MGKFYSSLKFIDAVVVSGLHTSVSRRDLIAQPSAARRPLPATASQSASVWVKRQVVLFMYLIFDETV